MMRIRGFSLVELMVALTIGLIILAAVSTLFVSSKQTYTTQDRLARLQENARFAMHFILKDLRKAGYFGCVSELTPGTINNTLNNKTDFAWNAQIPIEGVNNIAGAYGSPTGTWYPSANNVMPTNAIPGTDAVTVRMADSDSDISLNQEMPNESAVLKTSSINGLKEGDIIMVSDCASADIMQITQLNPADSHIVHDSGANNVLPPGNATQVLSKMYSPSPSPDGTRIMKFVTRRYFISTGASGNPALFRQDNIAAAVEMVDGIENLQVLYGKDTDSDGKPNIYLKAGDAGLQTDADWSSVRSVRVGILARTVNEKDTDVDSNTYDIDGDGATDFPAQNDRNKRRVFQAAVQLRNLQ